MRLNRGAGHTDTGQGRAACTGKRLSIGDIRPKQAAFSFFFLCEVCRRPHFSREGGVSFRRGIMVTPSTARRRFGGLPTEIIDDE
jgi:hypothetical protein